MTAKPSPLQLKNIVILEERIGIFPQECQKKAIKVNVDFQVKFGEAEIEESKQKFPAISFLLKVNEKKKKVPFKAYINGIALFDIDLNDEKNKRLLVINGTVLIFGFLRGYLFAKLNLLPNECRLLPAVNLIGVIEEALKEEQEQN